MSSHSEVQVREKLIQSLLMQIETFSSTVYSPLDLLELLRQNVQMRLFLASFPMTYYKYGCLTG